MRRSTLIGGAIAARLASAGTAVAGGRAVVINQCDYEIPLQNVPSGGAAVNGNVAAHGGKWSSNWQQLSSGGGWSIKVNPLNDPECLMQYEYTYQDDEKIWYDMSFVDGSKTGKYSKLPTWAFVSPDANPAPHHEAYMNWDDDAQGMQTPVAPSATVTLILCTESTGGSSAQTTDPVVAPAPTTLTTTTSSQSDVTFKKANVNNAPAPTTTPAPVPTPASTPAPTSATAPAQVKAPAANVVAAAPAADDGDVAVVTEYETKVVTAVVTETAHARRRRHAHNHAHHGHPQ